MSQEAGNPKLFLEKVICLKGRDRGETERPRKRFSFYWFTAQMVATAMAGPSGTQEPGIPSEYHIGDRHPHTTSSWTAFPSTLTRSWIRIGTVGLKLVLI